MVREGRPYLRENLAETNQPFKNADLQLSASAVTSSEKSSINTNKKSSFPMSLRWTTYIAPKPPKGTQKYKVTVFVQNVNNNIP